eukprot:820105-Pleurochrysis_carterae.AAC.1
MYTHGTRVARSGQAREDVQPRYKYVHSSLKMYVRSGRAVYMHRMVARDTPSRDMRVSCACFGAACKEMTQNKSVLVRRNESVLVGLGEEAVPRMSAEWRCAPPSAEFRTRGQTGSCARAAHAHAGMRTRTRACGFKQPAPCRSQ